MPPARAREEKPFLSEFFRAAQLRDSKTLAKLATVSFDPAIYGTVASFTITKVEERTEPLRIEDPALASAYEQAWTAMIKLSLATQMLQVSQYDGDVVTKAVTVRANDNVKFPSGRTGDSWYRFTVQRVRLKTEKPGGTLGRWVITKIEPVCPHIRC